MCSRLRVRRRDVGARHEGATYENASPAPNTSIQNIQILGCKNSPSDVLLILYYIWLFTMSNANDARAVTCLFYSGNYDSLQLKKDVKIENGVFYKGAVKLHTQEHL